MKPLHTLLPLSLAMTFIASAKPQSAFHNPLYQGEDPWVIRHENSYYMCSSGPSEPTAVYVSKSPTLTERGEKVKVWEDGDNYRRVFAPELHFIQGKWYIYFCADVRSEGWKHMAVVLQANTDNPLDGFTNRGVLFTGDEHGNAQANDITVVTYKDQLYAFWGSLADKIVEGAVMAPMDSPTRITAHRKEIGLHAEGPRAILRNGKLIMTGAEGGFASKDYRLSALIYSPDAGPIDDKKSWKPLGTLLKTTDDVWGPSRASFTTSPDGKENWVMYHSKIFNADDNGMRAINIKKFTFKEDDTPDFGTAASPTSLLENPSGDPGMGELYEAEDWQLSGDAAKASTNKNFTGTGYVDGFSKKGAKATFTADVPAAGVYRVILRYANGVKVEGEQQSFPKIYPPAQSTLSLYVNGAKIKRTQFHRTTNWDVWMFQGENLQLKAGKNEIAWQNDEGDVGQVTLDSAAVAKSSTPIHGLTGSYYNNRDLTDQKLTRLDPEISFNWGNGSPDPLIENDTFSVRWEGFITPLYSETYTFHSKSDNGRRLWIDKQPVIDKWLDDYDQTYTGTIKLEAGKKYPITFEYYEDGGGANTRLEWSSESQPREVIPSGRLEPAAK
ncbi:family 43 glycosylhydrolase [Luteolibacter yonseiensis]|uniref:Family 43 glycosylhydrolase n=1 Tax=Luteolibacter yonseiensis TaxID=1144680 RepID=A0A934R927_9BACT|nr:PA14 domain-containing protein [Luteolibacter yonseiensis]MBK1818446.1 family 43 glycosylhydrolase [Luteolibacter yonseiensis]